jgi:hypothetical protein
MRCFLSHLISKQKLCQGAAGCAGAPDGKEAELSMVSKKVAESVLSFQPGL